MSMGRGMDHGSYKKRVKTKVEIIGHTIIIKLKIETIPLSCPTNSLFAWFHFHFESLFIFHFTGVH